MKKIHVAVGVIKNREGRILISKRDVSQHQGGLWEFPGGKVEPDETIFQALKRELLEELDLNIFSSAPLIKISHDYGDKQVLLDVHYVYEFEEIERYHLPNAIGREGQPIAWVSTNDLENFAFPAANAPIITAIKLPNIFAITGDASSVEEYIKRIELGLKSGIKLIQLRAKAVSFIEYKKIFTAVEKLCCQYDAFLQLNISLKEFLSLNINNSKVGLHLNSKELRKFQSRDLLGRRFVSASCHNQEEIDQAKRNGVDFICLSPIQKTKTHPEAQALGWEALSELAPTAGCPVYALGGMSEQTIQLAVDSGGQGIAGISTWWDNQS